MAAVASPVPVLCRVEGMDGPVVVQGEPVVLGEALVRQAFVCWVRYDPDGMMVLSGRRGRAERHWPPRGVTGPGYWRLVGAAPRTLDVWVSEVFLVVPPHPSIRTCIM